MIMTNKYYPHGSVREQALYSKLINESISIKGEEFFYIPRKLVAKDSVLTEDVLSRFKGAYPFDGYVDEVDHWGGNGALMTKFGVYLEEQATITVSKSKWDDLVGSYGETIIPGRPCEGDLLWFPTTQSLLEIMFVDHQSQFYQLHKQFVYKLKVELFRFSSERIETGIEELDNLALEKSFDLLTKTMGGETIGDELTQEDSGLMIVEDPVDNGWDSRLVFRQEADKFLDFNEKNPFGDITR